MVVYGDSHTLMWLPAFEAIARTAHWKLEVLGRFYCPAELVTIANQATWADPGGPYAACDQWHQWAVHWINVQKPNLLVISQVDDYGPPSVNGSPLTYFSETQWRKGLAALFNSIHVPRMREVLLGSDPTLAQAAPTCLSAHPNDIQACSTPAQSAIDPLNQVDRATALAAGVKYVDTIPWFCSTACTAIIDHYVVYVDQNHITATWATYLENVLAQSLGFPPLPD